MGTLQRDLETRVLLRPLQFSRASKDGYVISHHLSVSAAKVHLYLYTDIWCMLDATACTYNDRSHSWMAALIESKP